MADTEAAGDGEQRAATAPQPALPAGRKKRSNMHEGIGIWCDCCSCEAEPYWAELADEMGIDLSDYEDEARPPGKDKG